MKDFKIDVGMSLKELDDVNKAVKQMIDIISGKRDKLSLPIEELGLSVRSMTCLKCGRWKTSGERVKIVTIGDLVKYSMRELLNLENLGRKTMWDIHEALCKNGVYLKGSEPASEVSEAANRSDGLLILDLIGRINNKLKLVGDHIRINNGELVT